jgi:hypothetical protein
MVEPTSPTAGVGTRRDYALKKRLVVPLRVALVDEL